MQELLLQLVSYLACSTFATESDLIQQSPWHTALEPFQASYTNTSLCIRQVFASHQPTEGIKSHTDTVTLNIQESKLISSCCLLTLLVLNFPHFLTIFFFPQIIFLSKTTSLRLTDVLAWNIQNHCWVDVILLVASFVTVNLAWTYSCGS